MAKSSAGERDGRVRLENGHHLYYRIVGDGPLTVMIPAATWWGHQADCLAQEHTVLLYDTRGRGRSDPLTDDIALGLDVDVADIETIRIHCGIGRVALIGWSYLGGVVVLYAARHPHVVDRIVQVGPLMLSREPHWNGWMSNYAARAAALADRESVASALLTNPTTSAIERSFEIRDGLRATILPQFGDPSVVEQVLDTVGVDLPNEHPAAIGKWFERNMAAIGDWNLRSIASTVTVPVLTVHGTEDNLPLEGSLEWVEALPMARLLQMKGVGHYPFFECADVFFNAVSEFLRGRWPVDAQA